MSTEDHIDRMLDEALEMTFPASDPFTVYTAESKTAESGARGQKETAAE